MRKRGKEKKILISLSSPFSQIGNKAGVSLSRFDYPTVRVFCVVRSTEQNFGRQIPTKIKPKFARLRIRLWTRNSKRERTGERDLLCKVVLKVVNRLPGFAVVVVGHRRSSV